MRDFLCDKSYLNKKIEFNNNQIRQKTEEIFSLKKDTENGIQRYPRKNEDIIFDTKKRLFQLLNDLIHAKYSLGEACTDLEEIYLQGITIIKDIGYKSIGYVNFIQYFSIGILLEMPEDKMNGLIKKADEEKVDDILFDFLVSSYNLKREICSTCYQKENPYKKTEKIINMSLSDKEKASALLKAYVDKWIQGHADYGWKAAHKNPGYVGLWSFESAAIAKIFDLNDKALEKDNHYPYDLAHYKKNKIFSAKAIVIDQKDTIIVEKQAGIPLNKEIEQIIPIQFHELVNQLIADYAALDDHAFWSKYNLNNIWFMLDEYKEEKQRGQLLGAIIIEALVNNGYILQLDYKDDIDDYVENMKNFWNGQDVKLVRFERDNEQKYYAKIPTGSDLKALYEINVVEEK